MYVGLSVSLSAQLALNHRLETLANNIANLNTVGFRAEGIHFSSLVADGLNTKANFASPGDTFISTQSGSMIKTDNPLDIAVKGDAWFAINTSKGIAYTRDGRLQIGPTGALQTITGNAVLDAGGAGILVDPTGGQPSISSDGTITQGSRQIGAIGLFQIDPKANLTRAENASVVPDKPATPVLDFTKSGVVQGFVEGANVDPVLEISKLIAVQRDFEHVKNVVSQSENSLMDAIKTLGSQS